MRMSQLAAAAGLPVATVKYYLRVGLLPPGTATGATQATYTDEHAQRLRLVRALVEVAGLSIADVGSVVARLDSPADSWHEVLGAVHTTLPPHPPQDGAASATAPSAARELVERLGWDVPPSLPALRQLDRALGAAEAAGLPLSPAGLTAYAEAAHRVGEVDVAEVPTSSPQEATRHVVLGTLLYEPVLLALRRLAQVDASATRFAATPPR